MDELFRRYAAFSRAIGYFFSALMVFVAFVVARDSFLMALPFAGAGVGTLYATRWLYHRMTDDL